MGDEDDAKDILQDAFVHAFSKIKELRKPETFSAWIKRLVINHCINALKKKNIVTTDIDEVDDLSEGASSDGKNEDAIKYEVKRILKAIDQISEGCRTVLNL